jgi:hypothetical protein
MASTDSSQPRTPSFVPRGRQPRRWIGITVFLLAVLAFSAIILHTLVGMNSTQPSLVPTNTAAPTAVPTQPSLPLLHVQPWRDLPADARLGGLSDGFTKTFGPRSDPNHNDWAITLSGKTFTVGGIPVFDLRYASDGQPHFDYVSVLYGPHNSLSPELRESIILSFLPKDAVYVGPASGANVLITAGEVLQGYTYTSASLATIFAPHPDRVFFNGQNQGVTPGTFTLTCTDGGIIDQQDLCILATGTLS